MKKINQIPLYIIDENNNFDFIDIDNPNIEVYRYGNISKKVMENLFILGKETDNIHTLDNNQRDSSKAINFVFNIIGKRGVL